MPDESTIPEEDEKSHSDDGVSTGEAASEATGPDDYDGAWKEMSDRFFAQFLQLCHPKAYADIDWQRGVVSLDKDLKKLLPKSKTSSRWADKLMRVWRRSQPEAKKDFVGSEPGIVYLHMEFQNQRDEDRCGSSRPCTGRSTATSARSPTRLLLDSRYERHDVEALLDFVDWLMQLPEPFEERLDKEVEKMEATKRVPYTTPWERRGLEKGRKEGQRQGKAELFKSMASQRFGELSEGDAERIDRADVDTLDRWSRRLFDAERFEDLFDDESS